MIKPLISVVMSVYNEEAFLSEAIDSILNQSEQNFEFIIIDDASTDRSTEIIRGYRDQRIRLYVNSKNEGLTKNLNKGLALARGGFIARMDGDDISHPDRFRKQLEYLERYKNIMLCSCWTRSFGQIQAAEKIRGMPEQLRVMMLFRPVLMHPGFMIRRELIEEGIYYDETFRTAQDYDFQVRVSEKYDVGIVRDVLMDYRVHKKQISHIRNNEQFCNANRVRTKLLEKLEVQLGVEERKTYDKWVIGEKNVSEDDLRKAEKITEKIIDANNKLGLYKSGVLYDELYKLLFHWVIRARVRKKFFYIISICGFDIKKWMLCIQRVIQLVISFLIKTTGKML